MIALTLAVIANAFGRRFAGGLLGQWFGNIGGTQVARLVQALIAGATVAALAPAWWWGAYLVPFVFLGATMGFPPSGMIPRSARHVLDIAVRHGLASTAPIALGLALCHFMALGFGWGAASAAWVLVAGLARGPIYWAATLWQPCVPVLGLNPDGLPDPPAWAEFWAGGALGAGLALALGVV